MAKYKVGDIILCCTSNEMYMVLNIDIRDNDYKVRWLDDNTVQCYDIDYCDEKDKLLPVCRTKVWQALRGE